MTNPTETASSTPGAVLKRCREYHGLTLEDAAETTKIGISYLRALEGDQIREFPNLTYLKGFLRIYATYLGLNPDDMSRMYDKANAPEPGDTLAAPPGPDAKKHSTKRLAYLQKLVLPAFLLLLILVTATFFKRPPHDPIRPEKQPSPSAPVAALLPVQPIFSSARLPKPLPLPAENRTKELTDEEKVEESLPLTKQPVDTVKGFILKIRVTLNGTLNASVDGSAPQRYELTTGDVIEWKADKTVALDVSDAGGIDIELNGKPHKALGPAGKAVYVEFDSDGIKP